MEITFNTPKLLINKRLKFKEKWKKKERIILKQIKLLTMVLDKSGKKDSFLKMSSSTAAPFWKPSRRKPEEISNLLDYW